MSAPVRDRRPADSQPLTASVGRVRRGARAVQNAATGLLGGILGLAPHVLHHH